MSDACSSETDTQLSSRSDNSYSSARQSSYSSQSESDDQEKANDVASSSSRSPSPTSSSRASSRRSSRRSDPSTQSLKPGSLGHGNRRQSKISLDSRSRKSSMTVTDNVLSEPSRAVTPESQTDVKNPAPPRVTIRRPPSAGSTASTISAVSQCDVSSSEHNEKTPDKHPYCRRPHSAPVPGKRKDPSYLTSRKGIFGFWHRREPLFEPRWSLYDRSPFDTVSILYHMCVIKLHASFSPFSPCSELPF